MRGYIGVTDPGWFGFNKSSNHREVIFWRRSQIPVKLQAGDYFFFLIRGKLPRYIQGFGKVKIVGIQKISQMWDQFGKINGSISLEAFEERLGKTRNQIVAYYYLSDVIYLNPDNFVTDKEIHFAKAIMAGKFISSEEAEELLKKIK